MGTIKSHSVSFFNDKRNKRWVCRTYGREIDPNWSLPRSGNFSNRWDLPRFFRVKDKDYYETYRYEWLSFLAKWSLRFRMDNRFGPIHNTEVIFSKQEIRQNKLYDVLVKLD